MGNNILEGLFYLLGFGSILFLAYVTSKFVAKKANKIFKGKYISIIEIVNLGPDKRLYLVKAGKQFILIATSGKNVSFLTNVEIENFEESEVSQEQNLFNFKGYFEKYLHTYVGIKQNDKEDLSEETLKEKKSKNVFRKNLEKLKTIVKAAPQQNNKNGDENTDDEK
ncbi:MAG TPA: flagellar biosynthetic protein FliO [Clostridiaceae bacterium]|nr:flagellar biosynthetic protein FliO [Clostridiaceae bacterium]